MSKDAMLGYRKLWDVEDHLRGVISDAFDDTYCKDIDKVANFVDLRLRGIRPKNWPIDKQGRTAKAYVRTIQRGVLFYCMEDLLWPHGRDTTPNNKAFWGSALYKERFIRCGENGTLELNEALRSRRHPGRQPIALRTYSDALQYHMAGEVADHLFLIVNERWAARSFHSNSTTLMRAIVKPVRHRILYIHGKSPSRISKNREPEIRYVVGTPKIRDVAGTNDVGKNVRDMFAPPTRAYEHAFRRQLNKLCNDWQSATFSGVAQPTDEWVLQHLGIWEGDDKDHEGGLADNGVVKTYKKALKERLLGEPRRNPAPAEHP